MRSVQAKEIGRVLVTLAFRWPLPPAAGRSALAWIEGRHPTFAGASDVLRAAVGARGLEVEEMSRLLARVWADHGARPDFGRTAELLAALIGGPSAGPAFWRRHLGRDVQLPWLVALAEHDPARNDPAVRARLEAARGDVAIGALLLIDADEAEFQRAFPPLAERYPARAVRVLERRPSVPPLPASALAALLESEARGAAEEADPQAAELEHGPARHVGHVGPESRGGRSPRISRSSCTGGACRRGRRSFVHRTDGCYGGRTATLSGCPPIAGRWWGSSRRLPSTRGFRTNWSCRT